MARVWFDLWARLWGASQAVFAALDPCARVENALAVVHANELVQPAHDMVIGAKHSKIKLRARPREINFAPGTVLLREWGDREHQVAVTADGLFEYEGSTFKRLTAVARQITGTHWSGPLFFGLTDKAGAQ